MYPVLIGSKALKYHGYEQTDLSDCDVDLIVNKELAKEILYNCDKKDGKMCFFQNTKYDLHMVEDYNSNMKIFNFLNDEQAINKKLITLTNIGQVILPPLELLYVIKKSHVMRIMSVTNNQQQNLDIWHKQMIYYTWIRNKFGYLRLDQILYGDDKFGEVIAKNDEYRYLRDIYLTRFSETVQKVGDTTISMEKTEDEFFNDKVKRHVEHDELHKLVAKMNRNTTELIFEKLKDDSNMANLSLGKFKVADYNDIIEMFREELMVLLLERKWIPECVMNGYTSINRKQRENEMKDLIPHYMTNLCGSGHYWLRRYVLDHYNTIIDIRNYEGMDQIVRTVANIELDKKVGETFDEFITNKHPVVINNFDEFVSNFNLKIRKMDALIYYGDKLQKIPDIYEKINKIVNNLSGHNIIVLDSYESKSSVQLLYDSTDNIGFVHNKNNIYIFKLIVKLTPADDNKDKWDMGKSLYDDVKISVEYLNLLDNEMNETFCNYSEGITTEYYYSDDCTENQSPNENTYRYLSSVGSMDTRFKILIEYIAKSYLDIWRDKESI
jgi:hypothetical protein